MKLSTVCVPSLFLGLAAVLGCANESPKVTETAIAPSSVPAAEPKVLAAVAAVAPRYDEEAFEVVLHVPGPAKSGEPLPVSVVLVAKAGFKVNPEYPIKFAFEAVPEVAAEPAVLRKEQGTIEKSKAELRGVVTIRTPGARSVSGKLSFSVCTEERCLIEKRDLSVTVNAS